MTRTRKHVLMIDASRCIGCHSCVVACKMEHELPAGPRTVKVIQIGPLEANGAPLMRYETIGYYATTVVMDLVLGVLAAVVVAWFSRQREFRADRGAADMMGNAGPMQSALARLGGLQPGQLPRTVEAMGITGVPSRLMKLFSTHPPIEERIAALQARAR